MAQFNESLNNNNNNVTAASDIQTLEELGISKCLAIAVR